MVESAGGEVGLAGRATLERLAGLTVGPGVAHGQMVVFPAQAPNGSGTAPLEYRTLTEAIAEGSVEVTEQASASVPELVLWNRGRAMVLVLDGEEIVGGRQNRIVNASFLVGAGQKVVLPVTCVEHGRWHETSRQFTPGEVGYHSLRREKHAQVSMSMRLGARPEADQGAIWGRLAERQAAERIASPTGAMHDMFSMRGPDLADYERAFPYVPGAVGLVVALQGRMAGADLFDQPRTAAALWPKLVRSYALDAGGGPAGEPVARERAVRLLARTQGARCEVYPSLALGHDVRLTGDGVVGSALVYQGTPVHVGLFRVHGGPAPDAGPGRMARASTRRWFRSRP